MHTASFSQGNDPLRQNQCHCHPEMTKKGCTQMARLEHGAEWIKGEQVHCARNYRISKFGKLSSPTITPSPPCSLATFLMPSGDTMHEAQPHNIPVNSPISGCGPGMPLLPLAGKMTIILYPKSLSYKGAFSGSLFHGAEQSLGGWGH